MHLRVQVSIIWATVEIAFLHSAYTMLWVHKVALQSLLFTLPKLLSGLADQLLIYSEKYVWLLSTNSTCCPHWDLYLGLQMHEQCPRPVWSILWNRFFVEEDWVHTNKYIIYFNSFQLYSQGEKLFFQPKSLYFLQN